MKRKILIGFLVILILGIVAFMIFDLFFAHKRQDNPFELRTDSLNKTDSRLVCYKEIYQIKPDIEELNGIALDGKDKIVLVGSKLLIYDQSFKLSSSYKLSEAGSCVAMNSKNEIFIGVQNHIEVLNMMGKFLRKWNTGNNESILTGMAVDETSVYIADAKDRLVHQFDFSGKYIRNYGREDSVKGVPSIILRSTFFDVFVGRDNEVWITNPGRYLLESFDKKGNFKSSWGKSSEKTDGFCGCCNPTNIALLADGSFVTSEKANARVKIYSPSGEFICVVAGNELFDEGTKGLDLAVDSKNRIYVLDPLRKQIRIFVKK